MCTFLDIFNEFEHDTIIKNDSTIKSLVPHVLDCFLKYSPNLSFHRHIQKYYALLMPLIITVIHKVCYMFFMITVVFWFVIEIF